MIRHYLGQNFISLLSVLIAVTGLTMTTWRNERSEHNRNIRYGCFEILKSVAELQRVVHFSYYGKDQDKGNPIIGWSYINYMEDLAHILPAPIAEQTHKLAETWGQEWETSAEDQASNDKIISAISDMRTVVLSELQMLR